MPDLTFTVDGAPVSARPGQTVGAALMAAGLASWRTTRKEDRPRGLFCGIGVCFDCLITADGVPNQRACLTPAREGMSLETGAMLDKQAADKGSNGVGAVDTLDEVQQ